MVDHGFAEVIGFFGAVLLLTKKVGPKLAKWLDDQNEVSMPDCHSLLMAHYWAGCCKV